MEKDAEPLSAQDKKSFAYKTVKERLPTIITKIIDNLHRFERSNWDEAKSMINKLSQLRYEVMTDKQLAPLDPAVAAEDIVYWDKAFRLYEAEKGVAPTWFTAPWLFWECYAYRCVQLFADTSGLPGFDVFEGSKRDHYRNSISAMETIADHFESVLNDDDLSISTKHHLFDEFLQMCLWGNECDLSLSGMAENALSRDPLSCLSDLKSQLVVDDSAAIWEFLSSKLARKVTAGEACLVTIILDNAGLELFGDFCFAEFLLRSGFATRVAFQGKAVPWFVSDVTQHDFTWTLEQLSSPESNAAMQTLGKRWQSRLRDGSFEFGAHRFWTTPFDYAAMAEECPELYAALAKEDLLIFKGDLNYRKLVGDLAWPPMTTFRRAVRGFKPAPFFALRLCKADVAVGLESGASERLAASQPDWMVIGKYGIIQCDL